MWAPETSLRFAKVKNLCSFPKSYSNLPSPCMTDPGSNRSLRIASPVDILPCTFPVSNVEETCFWILKVPLLVIEDFGFRWCETASLCKWFPTSKSQFLSPWRQRPHAPSKYRSVTFQKTEVLNRNVLNSSGNRNMDWQTNVASSVWLSVKHIMQGIHDN